MNRDTATTSPSAMWGGRFEASVIRYPTGRYGICGNVPESLTEFRDGLYPCRASKVWNTEQEALEALRKAEAE